METIGLLQKTELVDNSITFADFAHPTPRQMGKDGLRHDFMRGIRDGLEGKGT
jgi:hypothetical protein